MKAIVALSLIASVNLATDYIAAQSANQRACYTVMPAIAFPYNTACDTADDSAYDFSIVVVASMT